MQAVTGELVVGLVVAVGGVCVAFILRSICQQIEKLSDAIQTFEGTVNSSMDTLRRDIQSARAERESSAGKLHDRINHIAEAYVSRAALASELDRFISHEFCLSKCPRTKPK